MPGFTLHVEDPNSDPDLPQQEPHTPSHIPSAPLTLVLEKPHESVAPGGSNQHMDVSINVKCRRVMGNCFKVLETAFGDKWNVSLESSLAVILCVQRETRTILWTVIPGFLGPTSLHQSHAVLWYRNTQ